MKEQDRKFQLIFDFLLVRGDWKDINDFVIDVKEYIELPMYIKKVMLHDDEILFQVMLNHLEPEDAKATIGYTDSIPITRQKYYKPIIENKFFKNIERTRCNYVFTKGPRKGQQCTVIPKLTTNNLRCYDHKCRKN